MLGGSSESKLNYTMIQWSEKFETGHSLIDSQHRMLIDYINRLEGMSRSSNPSRAEVEFCVQLLGFMETYIAVHFTHEEGCMVSHKCPVSHENKKAHHDFLRFFRQFKARFDAEGCRPEILEQLHQTCGAWIQQHILRIDVQLRPCLNQTPPAESPG